MENTNFIRGQIGQTAPTVEFIAHLSYTATHLGRRLGKLGLRHKSPGALQGAQDTNETCDW